MNNFKKKHEIPKKLMWHTNLNAQKTFYNKIKVCESFYSFSNVPVIYKYKICYQ